MGAMRKARTSGPGSSLGGYADSYLVWVVDGASAVWTGTGVAISVEAVTGA